MKEIRDQALLNQYLQLHHLHSVFGAHLRPHLALYAFDRGERICAQGQVAHTLYVLVQGKIKVHTSSAEGRTLVLLSFKQPLEVIGEIEYFQEIETLNTVEAVTPVWMIGIRYEVLDQYGRNHLPLLQFLLEILTRKFVRKTSSLSHNLMQPVEVRLASYLLSICPDESDAASLADAANMIGTSYRHLNRVVQQLCAEGLIERDKGRIRIKDRERLLALGEQNIYE